MPNWLQAIDWTALHWIRDTLHCGFLDLLMPAITALGNGGIIWLIAAAALSVSKKYRKYGIVLFAALAAGALAATLIGILISTAAMCLMKAWIRAPREINGQGASADSSAQKGLTVSTASSGFFREPPAPETGGKRTRIPTRYRLASRIIAVSAKFFDKISKNLSQTVSFPGHCIGKRKWQPQLPQKGGISL